MALRRWTGWIWALLVLMLATAPVRAAQDEGAGTGGPGSKDPRRALERFQEYLERKPYHDWAFDKLVEAAVSLNELKSLVDTYAKRLENDKENRATRVVLGRLQARSGDADKGLATLRAIADPEPGLLKLIGELELKQNQPKRAVDALEKAAAASTDRELSKQIFKVLGEAHLATGARDDAAKALARLADLEPESFNARLEVATSLATHGLVEEGLVQFSQAERLAGDDSQKRCRVLAEIGKLHEVRLEIEKALGAYRTAIDLMVRGNWLKRELEERVVAIHKRGGSLDKLVVEAAERAKAHPEDLDAREFQALALQEAGKKTDAAAVLAEAEVAFPDDLKVARARIALLGDLGQRDLLIADYQRALTKHPDEFEMYLELGKVFAEGGKLEQARLQWQRTLTERIADPALCGRIAELYASYGMRDDARVMYEKAVQLEPREIARYADWIGFLSVVSPPTGAANDPNAGVDPKNGLSPETRAEIGKILDRAEAAAGEDPSRLEQVAGLLREQHEVERAAAMLARALQKKPKDARLHSALADVLLELDRRPEAVAALHSAADFAEESTLRKASVDRIVRIARKDKSIHELIVAERGAIEKMGSEISSVTPGTPRTISVAPYLVLGRVLNQERDPAGAIAAYEALLALVPEQEDAHAELGRLYEDQGDSAAALVQYEKLVAASPKNRRQWQKEIARIHLAQYDQDQALTVYREMLKASPDNPGAFKEVADLYQKLNLTEEAIECMQQAVRLKPDDGRYRLQLARLYQQTDEIDKARAEIAAAIHSKESDVKSDARKQDYALLSQEGQVEAEIKRLQKRIEDNPYDLESVLSLGDIYVRELEYELSLEMLERILRFQPRDKDLLGERARVLVLMDRHDEAIADYEVLQKLPDTDRGDIAMRIVEAAIDAGDLDRAAKAGETVREKARLARVYQKHDLFDRALELLKSAASTAPRDARLQIRMSDVELKLGDRAAAAACLERALSIGGEDVQTLTHLGDLYHEMGQKDDVLACGRRMFALARVPEKEKSDKEKAEDEEDESSSTSSRMYYGGGYFVSGQYFGGQSSGDRQYDEFLGRIFTFFQSKGLINEFAEIGTSELRLQPSNASLLWRVFNQLLSDTKNVGKALELLDFVRAETVDKKKSPTGITLSSWRDQIDSRRVQTCAKDNAVAAARATELKARVARGSESEIIELVQLLDLGRAESEAQAELEKGLVRFPDSAQLHTSLGLRADNRKDYAAAAQQFARVIEILTPDPRSAEDEKTRALEFKRGKNDALQEFPLSVRHRVGPEHLQRLFDLTRAQPTALAFGLGARQTAVGARLKLVHALLKSGRKDEAAKALEPLLPKDDGDLQGLILVANFLIKEDLDDEARAQCLRIATLEKKLEMDPVLGHATSWRWPFNTPMQGLARLEEKKGDVLAAYDRLRTYGSVRPAELLLSTKNQYAEAEKHYADLETEARARLRTASGDADTSAAREHLRDVAIRRAEILQFQKRWEDALADWRALAADLPDDWAVRNVTAAVLERLERYDDAVDEQFAIIDAKRKIAQGKKDDARPKPREIVPEPPPQAEGGTDSWIWQNLRYAGNSRQGRPSVNENYAAILRILLDRRQTSRAAEVMRRLAREDAQTFSWLGWELGQLVENYRLGAEGVPILRLLHGYNPNDENLSLQYARSLSQAQRFDEAERVFTSVVAKAGGNSYYREQAQRELSEIEKRQGKGGALGLADLGKTVAADPKNVKSRVKYARALIRERRFEEAHVQALAARELAPHLDDVSALLMDCDRALGRWKDLEIVLRKKLAEAAKGDVKFGLGIQIADLVWADGDEKGARDLLESEDMNVDPTGANLSICGWYMKKGLYEDALRIANRDLQAGGSSSWRMDGIKSRIARLQLLSGNLAPTLDETWRKIEEASTPGDKESAFANLIGSLRLLADSESLRGSLDEALGMGESLRARLTRVAADVATRKLAEADEKLSAVMKDEPQTLYLYPLWFGLARARGDYEAALARMKILEAINAGAPDRQLSTSVGQVSERDAFRAEMGSLLLKLGRKDEAIAVWQQIYDPREPQSQAALARLYRENRLFREAIAVQKTYLEKVGERNGTDLEMLGDLHLQLGEFDDAIAVFGRAEILEAAQADQRRSIRARILQAYRRAGKLSDALAEYKKRADKDKSDIELSLLTADIASELGDESGAVDCLERAATRAGFEKTVLPALLDRQLHSGDKAAAEKTLERILGSNLQEWERGTFAQRLAAIQLARGDETAARATLAKGQKDPESTEALSSMATFFEQHQKHEAAIELYRRALALDPKGAWMRMSLSRELFEAGQKDAALEELFQAAAQPPMAAGFDSYQAHLLRLTDTNGAVGAGPNGAVGAGPGDPDIAFRSALLFRARGQADLARPLFASLRDDRDRGLAACFGLLWCAEVGARWEEFEHEALELCERYEREIQDGGQGFGFEGLRRQIGESRLRRNDVEGAVQAWSVPAQRRGREENSWMYSYNNDVQSERAQLPSLLLAHGLAERALPVFDEIQTLSERGSGRYGGGGGYEVALERVGKRDQARALAWAQIDDPASELATRIGNNYYSYPDEENDWNDPSHDALRLAREDHAVDALIAKIRGELARRGDVPSLSRALRSILRAEKRWPEFMSEVEAAHAKSPDDTKFEREKLTALIGLKRYEEAYLLEKSLVDMESSVAGRGSQTVMVSSANGASSVRFQWAATQPNRSSSSYSYWRNSGFSGGTWRGRLMALAAAAGRHDEASKLEEHQLAAAEDVGETALSLAEACAGFDLAADVMRLCERAIREDPRRHAAAAWDCEVHFFTRLGPEVEAQRALAGRNAIFARDLALDPYDVELHLARARLNLRNPLASRERANLDLAGQDLELVRRLRPTAREPLVLEGWLRLREKDAARASALFEKARAEGLLGGAGQDAELDYGSGLALAELGRKDAAEPILRRALAADPENPAAKEAQALLQ